MSIDKTLELILKTRKCKRFHVHVCLHLLAGFGLF